MFIGHENMPETHAYKKDQNNDFIFQSKLRDFKKIIQDTKEQQN